MRLPDYHTHTVRCGHASGDPVEYVRVAQARDLMAIGIADHLPLLPECDPELTMSAGDLSDYVSEVQALKAAFPGYVLLGIEADYRPHTVSEVRSLLESHPFDYAVGSVHYLGDWGIDDPRQIEEYDDRDIDDVWIDYFQLVGDAAESGLFTILGHLDLVKKFGYRPTRTLQSELEHLVDRIARAGVVVEINTGGLHKPVREAYPAPDILRRLCAAGVPVTFGSDAHKPEEVGRDFALAAGLAQAAGYAGFAALEAAPDGGRAAVHQNLFELAGVADGAPTSAPAESARAGRKTPDTPSSRRRGKTAGASGL
jgi:histidinol-phosphatase (PHP family)